MGQNNEVETRPRTPQPDDALLVLDPETERFFKAETGIQDTEELRKHIIEVQQEAYKVSNPPPNTLVFPHGFVTIYFWA